MSHEDDSSEECDVRLPPIEASTRTLVVNIHTYGAGNDGDFYIGRGSTWGNPYSDGDRATNIARFKSYFVKRLAEDQRFRNATRALKGKTLLCFCKPLPCHGDVIAEWLDVQRA